MAPDRPLFIPVILGTVRRGRMSAHAANLLVEDLRTHAAVETELVDIAKLPLPVDDAGEAIKDPGYAALMTRADGLVIVAPEYIHKAVGIAGVSAGAFGGTRVIDNLLPVLRELGLVTIFWDINFSKVRTVFDEQGRLLDPAFKPRIDKFMKELIWMSKVLRHGREQITAE
jgi:NAD(P)H-dependent FMN reductase